MQKWWELKILLNRNKTIDKVQQSTFMMEKRRWRSIIERMIAIVQYLAGKCLAFRGSNSNLCEKNNGKFIKAVEMIAKFDPIMSDHINSIKMSKDKNIRMPHYLGKSFQNEIISLLADSIRKEIIRTVTRSKYFSIILDCTPDVSHIEQITFIIRCVNMSILQAIIEEYFVGFYAANDTTGKGLFKYLIDDLLPTLSLDVQNIRGQGYDNGSNMRGKHIGLQKRILNVNPRAMFVPCAAHSLNLVVNDAANTSGEIFGFLRLFRNYTTLFRHLH